MNKRELLYGSYKFPVEQAFKKTREEARQKEARKQSRAKMRGRKRIAQHIQKRRG